MDTSYFNLIASDGELYGHHQVFRDHFCDIFLMEAVRGMG